MHVLFNREPFGLCFLRCNLSTVAEALSIQRPECLPGSRAVASSALPAWSPSASLCTLSRNLDANVIIVAAKVNLFFRGSNSGARAKTTRCGSLGAVRNAASFGCLCTGRVAKRCLNFRLLRKLRSTRRKVFNNLIKILFVDTYFQAPSPDLGFIEVVDFSEGLSNV